MAESLSNVNNIEILVCIVQYLVHYEKYKNIQICNMVKTYYYFRLIKWLPIVNKFDSRNLGAFQKILDFLLFMFWLIVSHRSF